MFVEVKTTDDGLCWTLSVMKSVRTAVRVLRCSASH